jgi:hypothetical protein
MEKIIRLGNIINKDFGTGYAGNVYNKKGTCPTMNTMCGGGQATYGG